MKPKLQFFKVARKERIEVGIPSRNRNMNLLALLQALRTQVFQNWDLSILDDNPDDSLVTCCSLKKMIVLLEMEGHRCRIIKGPSKGITYAQNILLASCKKKLIARMDDDTIPENDNLIKLMQVFWGDKTGAVGAVGGAIPELRSNNLSDYKLPDERELARYAPFETPEFRYLHPEHSSTRVVYSLYSSFIYKVPYFREAGGFSLSFSPIAEKEDTDASLRATFLGAKLVFEPGAISWHFKAPMSGIRHIDEKKRQQMFKKDYENFLSRIKKLRDGCFNWEEERQQNLKPFHPFEEIDDQAGGIINLIDRL